MGSTTKDLWRLIDAMIVPPGRKISLAKHYDPGLKPDFIGKQRAAELLARSVGELAEMQARLYAQNTYALLIIFQAMDAAGKDGVIKHVMSGVNPQGCEVYSFKAPSAIELDHDYMWRTTRCLPERGRIGIFNRSYYEEVLVVRVHPEILARQKLPPGKRGARFWADRFHDINEFERHLVASGTRIVKVFLHISKAEQKQRFLDRLEDPEKHWKFSIGDLHERRFWAAYQRAFADMLTHTSTAHAPWWVVPSDNKWVSRALVSEILTSEIERLGLKHPVASPALRRELAAARKSLLAER